MKIYSCLPLFLAICLAAAWPSAHAETADPSKALVMIHQGKHWVWFARQDLYDQHKEDYPPFYAYADKAFEDLEKLWGADLPQQVYGLLVDPRTGGGFATGDMSEAHQVTHKATPGIGIAYDAFSGTDKKIKGYWGYAILTHEMVNLSTGAMASGGWPMDWWADHRSPFPLMTAVQIETDLMPQVAIEHAKQLGGNVEKMFTGLRDNFGFQLFARTFKTVREDGMDWSKVGKNPSANLTNYVCAYLQIGAQRDLQKYFTGVLEEYNATEVASIIKARAAWKVLPQTDPRRAELRDAFLHGNYQGAK